MDKKNIFLSGGNGFIGRNILEQLSGKYEISAPGRQELDLLDALAVEHFIRQNDFEVVIHAANIGGNRKDPGPQNMAELNMRMFFNIVRCKKHFGKMIHLGSGAEYGKQRDLKTVREDEFDLVVPSDQYGFYKYICSKYIENTSNITCLRIFGCYGKYEDYEYKFISNAICRALFGMPIKITNMNVAFSYLYIDDLIRIVDHFIAKDGSHKFYNMAPDEITDLLKIAKLVKAQSGVEKDIEIGKPGLGLEYTGSNELLKKEMVNFRFTPIKEGIEKLYKWYSENKNSIDKGRLSYPG